MGEATTAESGLAAKKLASASKRLSNVSLKVRTGSRFIPLITILLSVALFIAYALPAGYQQLAEELGLTHSESDPLTFDKIHQKWEANEGGFKTRLTDRLFGEKDAAGNPRTFGSYVEEFYAVGRPLAKIFLDQLLGKDFPAIITSVLNTVWQLSLYALIPGLAGLFYRRNFLSWFLASFVLLLAINASGVFGSLTTATAKDAMPISGKILFFLISQIIILLLAFRLRRHAQGFEFIRPSLQNWTLRVVLILIGVACFMGWGPGYTSRPAANTASAPAYDSQSLISTAIAQDAPAAPPAQTEPAQGQAAEPSADGSSWLWNFGQKSHLARWFYRAEFILLGLPLIYTLFRNSSPWPYRKNKYIVICLDGTSNTPDQIERGFAAQTNVYKLFKMLQSDNGGYVPTGEFDASLCKKLGERQVGLYYAGVGNKYDNNPLLEVLGLAAGMGADEIIERAYLDLIRVYRPGDRVVVVGFSRGAAIARLLVRAIDAQGAPQSVWTLYLFGQHRKIWSSAVKTPVPIAVLGCWDTVGSFGVAKTLFGINFQQLNMGKDLTVPDNIQKAYHMLALDERRDSFEPTLMDPDPIRPERIVEVWFPGDHANVGGGWATDQLSDITLDFLLQRISSGYAVTPDKEPGVGTWGVFLTAKKADKLEVSLRNEADEGDVAVVDPDFTGQVRSWFSRLYQYRARALPLHAVISETVFSRMEAARPAYAPEALFKLNEALDRHRDAVVAGIAKFAETQSLNDHERDKVISANECLRLLRWPDYSEDVKKKVLQRLDERDRLTGATTGAGTPTDAQSAEERRLKALDEVLNPERVLDNAALG